MTRSDVLKEIFGKRYGVGGAEFDMFLELYAEAVRLDDEETVKELKHPSVSYADSSPQGEPEEERITTPVCAPTAKGKPGPKPGKSAGAAGREAAALKVETHKRLLAFKEKNGAGAVMQLAKITNGALTDDEIRLMAQAAKMPTAKWKILAGALDMAEGTA